MTPSEEKEDLKTFDDNARVTDPAAARQARAMLGIVRRAAALLPVLPPVLRVKNLYFVLGYDDVRAALADDAVFATPYRRAMALADPEGEVSVLGYGEAETAQYQENLCQVMRTMDLGMARVMADAAAKVMRKKLDPRATQIDLMTDLMIPATLAATQSCFGVKIDDALYQWSMAFINDVFGPPGQPEYKNLAAQAGGRLLVNKIQNDIDVSKPDDQTVLGRMLRLNMPAKRIRPTLTALIAGALPTLPQAGYNIMKTLLARPDAMAMARAAANAGDDELLHRCLLEALRMRPIMPVIFRKCAIQPAAFGGGARQWGFWPGTWRTDRIPAGADVGMFCLTAGFDARRVSAPHRFDPTRPLSDNFAFGHGKHWCAGQPQAMAVLVQVFKPLLRRGEIRAHRLAPPTRFFLDYFAQNLSLALGGNGA